MRRIVNRLGGKLKKLRPAVVLATLLLISVPALAQEISALPAANATKLPQPVSPQTSTQSIKPTRQVMVSIPDRKLALVEGGRTLKVYSVAVGAPASPSPVGEFKVITRIENPTFYKPGTVIEPGPDNPLGTRWIGLNRKSYGIHGTNMPASIGQAVSHGCIRMHQSDLEELFTQLRPGDAVVIRAERDAEVDKAMVLEPTLEPVTTADNTVTTFAGDEQN